MIPVPADFDPAVTDLPISDQDLLGYYLELLPDEEMDRIRDRLATDSSLRSRLAAIESQSILKRIEPGPYEPSGDLVERTMAQIPPLPIRERSLEPTQADHQCRTSRTKRLASGSEHWTGQPASAADMLVSMVVTAIFLAMLAPGVLGFRETSRQLQCMENLRSWGVSFLSLANLGAKRQLPCPELNGPLAFAGVYAPVLADSSLVERPSMVRCPSISVPSFLSYIPKTKEILQSDPIQLVRLQHLSGGNYAYHLGHINEGRFVGAELRGRSDFAILGDAPYVRGNSEVWVLHGGRLVNLLYEDGHVSEVRLDRQFGLPDHPYLNRNGAHEAGLDINDSSLGVSPLPPFRWSQQR